MTGGLTLILVVVGAYLAAHVLFDWLGRRFLIVSGAEYLLLGILLGPEVAGVLQPTVVDRFAPFMTLALGWIGALVGAQFYFAELVRAPGVFYRVAFIEALTSFAATAALMAAALMQFTGAALTDAIVAGIAMGAIATASAPSGIALVSRELGRRGPVVQQLEIAAAIDGLIAIVAFGILLGVMHVPPPGVLRPPTATEWVVIAVGIGVVGGALFHLFLGDERDIDRLFISVAGALVLASGAAAYLRLSPLLTTMLIGVILVNTSHNRQEIRQVLGSVERPIYYVLLLFAGAAWHPADGRIWLVPVLLFLAIRVIVKLGSARLAARIEGTLDDVGPGWGRALLGHGGLALAIAFNYHLGDTAPLRDLVFTAAIASVLLTDVSSARLVRSVVSSYRRRSSDQPTAAAPAQPQAAHPGVQEGG